MFQDYKTQQLCKVLRPMFQQYIVGTWGAGPCIIVAFYNPETLTAGIAHIDALTNVSSLSKYIDIARDDTQSKLQIHLRGGDSSSRNKVIEVLDQLRKRDDVEIKSCAVMEPSFSGLGAMLAINAKTGETYANFN